MLWANPMRNAWLIIRREYLERVRTRSFLVLTLLLPAIVGASFILPMKVATMKSGKRIPHLVIVSSESGLGELVRGQLLAKDANGDEDGGTKDSAGDADQKYFIDVDIAPTEAERNTLRAKMAAGAIDGYIWLDGDSVAQRKVIYSGHNATDYWD